MKDGCITKLTITESSNRATQYKKIVDDLPVFRADKVYRSGNDIICKDTELIEEDFKEIYPDSDLWSTKYYIKIDIVDPLAAVGTNKSCPVIKMTVEKIHAFDTNIQTQLPGKYEQKLKVKSLQWTKLVSDKKSLIIIIF